MTLMAERSKFQFRMRDLLWAVSLIGVSIWFALALWRMASRREALIILFMAPAASFGIGYLFHRAKLGAIVSVVVALVVLLAWAYKEIFESSA
jgi:hypothetical protein